MEFKVPGIRTWVDRWPWHDIKKEPVVGFRFPLWISESHSKVFRHLLEQGFVNRLNSISIPSIHIMVHRSEVGSHGDQLEVAEAFDEYEHYYGHIVTLVVIKDECHIAATGAFNKKSPAKIESPEPVQGADIRFLAVQMYLEIEGLYVRWWQFGWAEDIEKATIRIVSQSADPMLVEMVLCLVVHLLGDP